METKTAIRATPRDDLRYILRVITSLSILVTIIATAWDHRHRHGHQRRRSWESRPGFVQA